MKTDNVPGNGERIYRNKHGNPVFSLPERAVKSQFVYKMVINNPKFYDELHKSKFINLLLELYYNQTLKLNKDNSQDILDIVKEVAEFDHIHDWDFVDKGNYMRDSGQILRFVCKECANYKRIDEETLHQGMNHIIDEAENAELLLQIPDSDEDDSKQAPLPPASIYD